MLVCKIKWRLKCCIFNPRWGIGTFTKASIGSDSSASSSCPLESWQPRWGPWRTSRQFLTTWWDMWPPRSRMTMRIIHISKRESPDCKYVTNFSVSGCHYLYCCQFLTSWVPQLENITFWWETIELKSRRNRIYFTVEHTCMSVTNFAMLMSARQLISLIRNHPNVLQIHRLNSGVHLFCCWALFLSKKFFFKYILYLVEKGNIDNTVNWNNKLTSKGA